MIKYATDDTLESLKGTKLGAGSEKKCFLKIGDNTRCLKVSYKNKSNQVQREIKFFASLTQEQLSASFLPKYYGAFETDQFIGYEQECFLAKTKGGSFDNVIPLQDYVLVHGINEENIRNELKALKAEMIQKNIICSDLHGKNIFRITQEGRSWLVVVDGFGAPELIPLWKYFKYFRKKKINRQWEKLIRRLKKRIMLTKTARA